MTSSSRSLTIFGRNRRFLDRFPWRGQGGAYNEGSYEHQETAGACRLRLGRGRIDRVRGRAAVDGERPRVNRRHRCDGSADPDRMGACRPDQDRECRADSRRTTHPRVDRRARGSGARSAAPLGQWLSRGAASHDGHQCLAVRPDHCDADQRHPASTSRRRRCSGAAADVQHDAATG